MEVRIVKKSKSASLVLSAVLALSLTLVGCGKTEGENAAQPQAEQKSEAVSVEIGMLKLTSSAPLFIGIEKGFFKEENIDAQAKWFEAAQPIAVATAAGSVDVGATGITASLYNMVAGGQKLVIVADKGREQQGYSSSALLFPSDSPLKSIKGLMEALKSKQVDAILLNEPNISTVVKEGYGKVIAQVGDEMEYQTSGIFFSPELANNKDAAERFLKAYAKATRYYYDAVLTKKDGKIVPGANYDEVVGIIAKYTDQDAELIKKGLPYIDRDGKLLEADIKTQVEWYAKEKLIDKAIDTKEIVNTQLLDEAVQKLGK
jgi:NitT/TauT family transport system substrate-binding protein